MKERVKAPPTCGVEASEEAVYGIWSDTLGRWWGTDKVFSTWERFIAEAQRLILNELGGFPHPPDWRVARLDAWEWWLSFK